MALPPVTYVYYDSADWIDQVGARPEDDKLVILQGHPEAPPDHVFVFSHTFLIFRPEDRDPLPSDPRTYLGLYCTLYRKEGNVVVPTGEPMFTGNMEGFTAPDLTGKMVSVPASVPAHKVKQLIDRVLHGEEDDPSLAEAIWVPK